ncbi:MAG: L-seryl-tRNA(Sec) selenium transferase [Candidatus Obscuribacterales bacterium]|nr:L-seryl-tRNA(Sec) selenium transferase [Candidatus Obscuribacterales bacterium]
MQPRLPQVDKVLRHPQILGCQERYQRAVVVKVVRSVLSGLREKGATATEDELAGKVVAELNALASPSMRKVINGTGVVLNTNLGRAPLSAEYLDSLKSVASGYCNLEYDLIAGKRGKRSSRIQQLLKILTGAESAIAVNNNAAALVLTVNCFALSKEVIVSRGELIEIGGSFRVPDVIESAGGVLREVGTTNKTRLSDYENAIGDRTGLVMRCHRSNFEVKGFTEQPDLRDLVKLCRRREIFFVEDLGSGALANMADFGLAEEPTVEDTLSADCDLVTFSGDKLLGGPQAGLIAGRKELVDRLASHPLYRALRLDKVSLFLLEQTLRSYLLNRPQDKLPTLALIAAGAEQIKLRVEGFVARANSNFDVLRVEMIQTLSAIGGGSMPGQEKASYGIRLRTTEASAHDLASSLRLLEIPVVALVREEETIIDFRTIQESEESDLLQALQKVDRQLTKRNSEFVV